MKNIYYIEKKKTFKKYTLEFPIQTFFNGSGSVSPLQLNMS